MQPVSHCVTPNHETSDKIKDMRSGIMKRSLSQPDISKHKSCSHRCCTIAHMVGNKGGRPCKEVVSIVQKADKAKMCWDVGDIGKECRGGKLPKSSKEETTHWSSGDVSSKTPTWRQISERCLIVLGKIAFRVFSFLSEFHMLASKRITYCACWRKEEMHSFLLLGLSHFYRSV